MSLSTPRPRPSPAPQLARNYAAVLTAFSCKLLSDSLGTQHGLCPRTVALIFEVRRISSSTHAPVKPSAQSSGSDSPERRLDAKIMFQLRFNSQQACQLNLMRQPAARLLQQYHRYLSRMTSTVPNTNRKAASGVSSTICSSREGQLLDASIGPGLQLMEQQYDVCGHRLRMITPAGNAYGIPHHRLEVSVFTHTNTASDIPYLTDVPGLSGRVNMHLRVVQQVLRSTHKARRGTAVASQAVLSVLSTAACCKRLDSQQALVAMAKLSQY